MSVALDTIRIIGAYLPANTAGQLAVVSKSIELEPTLEQFCVEVGYEQMAVALWNRSISGVYDLFKGIRNVHQQSILLYKETIAINSAAELVLLLQERHVVDRIIVDTGLDFLCPILKARVGGDRYWRHAYLDILQRWSEDTHGMSVMLLRKICNPEALKTICQQAIAMIPPPDCDDGDDVDPNTLTVDGALEWMSEFTTQNPQLYHQILALVKPEHLADALSNTSCVYVYVRGMLKGQPCGQASVAGSLCQQHSNNPGAHKQLARRGLGK